MRKSRETQRRKLLFAEERQEAILEQLKQKGKVTVEELTLTLRVSPPTVRTDLTRLEARGLLRRTHGGALGMESARYEPSYAERAVLHLGGKRAIAHAAASLACDGDTLLLDAGTTCYEIALCLKEFRRLTVVTNSLASAQALAENDGLEVVLIGGELQPRRLATLGPLAGHFLEPIRCDRAFIAVSGIHPVAGLTVIDFDAAQLKRKMMSCAAQSVAVGDSSKVGQVAFACVAPLREVERLITDGGITLEDRQALEDAGLRVMAAPGE